MAHQIPHNNEPESQLKEIPRISWDAFPALPPLSGPTVPPIGRRFLIYTANTILKFGTDEGEAYMTALARHFLGPPVPSVSGIVSISTIATQRGILLDRQPGTPLSELWPTLAPAQRSAVKTKLVELLVRMRTHVFSYIGRPGGQPYVTASDFGTQQHAFCTTRQEWDASRIRALREMAPSLGGSVDESRLSALEQVQRDTTCDGLDRPVLYHGDLSGRNILVDPVTLDVTGLLDWETANVAPAYFEYVEARLSGGHLPEWRAVLLDVLKAVLRRECEGRAGADEQYKRTLAAWDALVDIERYAQGYSDACYWTFEPPRSPGNVSSL